MKALILAAGRGSRLNYKTKNKPKALVKIKKKEILYYQLEQLKKFKIRDVAIIVGYRKKMIINFLKKEKFFNFTIIENNYYNTTDSAFSYSLAQKFIYQSDYIHLNCDIIFSKSVLMELLSSRKKNILACRSDLQLGNNMDLIKTSKSKIIKFKNKYFTQAEKKVFGIAKISANLSSILNKKIKIDLNKNKLNKKCFSYFDNLYKKINIYSIQFDKKNLNEINNLDDYKKTKRFY